MRVLGWQCDRGACAYYRIRLPLDALAARGHQVAYGGDLRTTGALDGVDVLVGQRISQDGPTQVWQAAARAGKTMLVYETDDDMFHIDPGNHGARALFTPAALDNARRNLAVSDLVTVSTETLAEVVSEHTSAPVVVLPNRIPRWVTEWTPPRTEVVTIGWAGSPTHAADWAECASTLRRFVARTPGVELHTMGARYTAKWEHARHTEHVASVDEYLRSVDFTIGLAPLRPSLFNRSKSVLKVLELSALGIPYVASDAGPYPGFAPDGVAGYLVARPHEWATALRMLVEDPAMRGEMAIRARELGRHHVIEDHAVEWERAYQTVLAGRVPA